MLLNYLVDVAGHRRLASSPNPLSLLIETQTRLLFGRPRLWQDLILIRLQINYKVWAKHQHVYKIWTTFVWTQIGIGTLTMQQMYLDSLREPPNCDIQLTAGLSAT